MLWLVLILFMPETLKVTVVVSTKLKSNSPVFKSLRTEVERMMPVQVEWRDLGRDPEELLDNPVVLKILGRCRSTGANTIGSSGPMGWTAKVDGEVLPFVFVDCDIVTKALGDTTQAQYGTALGRVVVHELYHALTRTGVHGEGLMKGVVDIHRLTSPGLKLTQRQIEEIRRTLK